LSLGTKKYGQYSATGLQAKVIIAVNAFNAIGEADPFNVMLIAIQFISTKVV
jgi:hypothetical protein